MGYHDLSQPEIRTSMAHPNPQETPTARSNRGPARSADRRRRLVPRSSLPGLALLAACAWALTGIGCSSSPTEPDESVTVAGRLAPGQIDRYPIPLTFEGLVRFTIEQLELRTDGEPDQSNLIPAIGFSLGRPIGDACQNSSTVVLAEGQARTYRLLAEDYCIQVFDPGALGPTQELIYVLRAETTE